MSPRRSLSSWLIPIALAAACGDDPTIAIDAPAADAPAVDAPVDAPAVDAPVDAPACAPRALLIGGQAVEPQGWTIVQSGSAAVTLAGDATQLTTTTVGGAGAHLLLTRAGALDPAQPFAISVELQVAAVAPHNPFDAAAAILAGFTPPFGLGAERQQMLYLDAARIGWADDSAQFAAAVTDGAFHTVRLDYDGAGVLQVRFDGTLALTRAGFVPGDTLAIGDQTNDPGVEATVRVRAVTEHCP